MIDVVMRIGIDIVTRIDIMRKNGIHVVMWNVVMLLWITLTFLVQLGLAKHPIPIIYFCVLWRYNEYT